MGMIYTLQIGSKSSHWIGYQALAGLGVGFAFQVPQIVAPQPQRRQIDWHDIELSKENTNVSGYFVKPLLQEKIMSLLNDI